ncbi:hypothetical protein F5X96DRAFT_665916 [Biscogniauxia mediterranea]|nr:hypothetical protein F5X96DRAFT_665916 [Biscogniauxia mediterranea]
MEPEPISKVIRPVGPAAQFNTSRHSLGLCRSVINTCRYTVSPSGLRRQQQQHPLKSVMENALARVMMRHGILCAGIAGEDTKAPAFVHLETIDLRRMVEWKEMPVSASSDAENSTTGGGPLSDRWDELLLRSLEKYHEPLWEDLAQKPGWKIVIHHDPRQLATTTSTAAITLDISFAFHHAYADGKSAYVFHRSLLRELNALTTSTTPPPPPELQSHTLYLPRAPALPPPLEHLVPLSLSWTYLLRTVFRALVWDAALVPSWLKPAPPWTGSLVDPSQPRCHLRLISVPGHHVPALLARCRARGAITLTGLLHGLVLAALRARLLSPLLVPTNTTFVGSTPISLAPYTHPPIDEDIHCLVTSHETRFSAERETIWAAAARATAQLRARAAALPRDDVVALLGYVSDWRAFLARGFGKPRAHTWEVSNVGSARFAAAEGGREEGGMWRIERSVFTQGANPLGAALKINVAGVVGEADGDGDSDRDGGGGGGGGVWITVGWQEGAVPADLAEGVVGDLRRWIGVLGEGGDVDVVG